MTTDTHQNHAAPLARSNSFFGAIKNIVTAPFSWFAGSDEFEDANGKRRRIPAASEDALAEDGSFPSRAKRMRVSSPDRDTQAYLDPPRSAFNQPRRTSYHSASASVSDMTRSPRKTLHIPSSSNQSSRNRRTLSPLPSVPHLKPQGITRTMSLDPPSHSSFSSRIQAAPTIVDIQPEPIHEDSMSTGGDVSMSPRRLRVRSSLTPQPSGTGFGPVVPPRRERGPDEPPPLTTLMSNPMFVRPSPAIQKQVAAEPPKQLTLGTLMDSQRSARALARQSSILFGTGSMTDVSARHPWPVNKAEAALHELEVYKTPLLPTRLKGATAVPDMFLHKERKHMTLMTDDRPIKPRLGTKSKRREKGKRKERESLNGTKPYAGEGGVKKWLARRKKEEEEAKEREQSEAMEDERAEEEEKHKEAEAEKKKREEELKVLPPSPPAFEPRVSREGPFSSSLRVGRTRIGRNHIERPVSRRAKFSAVFEDEDEDMEEPRAAEQKALEEAAEKAPAFELSAGFTFAKEATITHDLTHAKEPPITSLPFSLTKATLASPIAEMVKVAPILAPTTPTPALPKITLLPPTPEVVKAADEVPALPVTEAPTSSAAPNGVPNFFASSSVFAKAAASATPPSLLNASEVKPSKPAEAPAPHAVKVADATPSLFGAPSRPVSMFAMPTDSVAASSTSIAPPALLKEAEKPTLAPPSPAAPFTFEPPAKPAEPVPIPTPSLPPDKLPAAELAKPTAPTNDTSFTFGVPSPPPPSPAPAAVSTPAAPAATAALEEPKSVFTFGQPAPATTSTPASAPVTALPAADAPKSLFGTPPPATPFSFGQRPDTAPADKPATSSFSFGSSSTTEKKPATGFTFGSSNASTAAPAAPPAFGFGATPNGTTAADVSSKPFMFGSATSARPVTPPKAVEEVTMDESPARDMVLNGNGKAPERPTLNFSFNTPSESALFAQSPATTTAPFSFGAPGATVNPFGKEEKKETKPAVSFAGFGQASSTGFSFGQKPPESPTTTAPAPAPFQFAQRSPSAAPTSPFSFGAAPASAGPFGQSSAASAPSSPSTFNRPGSFSFGTPTTTQPAASPFAFTAGSQPASPATGNTTLPSGTTGSAPFTFGAGTNATGAPAVGFGAPSSAGAPAGGSLFTMGSAPSPMEGAGGRRIKGLPRRGTRR